MDEKVFWGFEARGIIYTVLAENEGEAFIKLCYFLDGDKFCIKLLNYVTAPSELVG